MRWIFDQLEFPENGHILDLGCGPGTVWLENQERVLPTWQVTMMDLSEGMVSKAREGLGDQNHRYGCADAQNLPFPANTFDAVIANHMLYHVPDFQRAIIEVARVLKPKGMFYAATNGSTHMIELFKLINDFAPEVNYQGPGLSFDLENGKEQLAPWFKTVEKREYLDSLKITESRPLADYIKSMSSIGFGSLNKDAEALNAYIQNLLDKQGVIKISKSVGVFVCKSK